MAFSDVALAGQISIHRAQQTQATSALDGIGTGTMYVDQVLIDNSNNTDTQVYVKMYDSSSTVTVGEASPVFIFPCAGGATAEYSMSPGGKFTNGVQACCVQEAGVAGTTDPAKAVSVTVLYHT